jgi:hypothetical protein
LNHEEKIIVASALNFLLGYYEGTSGKDCPNFVYSAKELLMVDCLKDCINAEIKRQ